MSSASATAEELQLEAQAPVAKKPPIRKKDAPLAIFPSEVAEINGKPLSILEEPTDREISEVAFGEPIDFAEPDPIAVAEGEGMPPLPEPVVAAPDIADLGTSVATSVANAEPEDDFVELAYREMCAAQDRAKEAGFEATKKAEIAKAAKKRAETFDEEFHEAAQAFRDAREGKTNLPLFDKPKAVAPKVESTPADDATARYEALAKETKLNSIGLTPKVVEILESHNLYTLADFAAKQKAMGGAPITSLAGITEPRYEKITAAMEKFWSKNA
jgi:hypothetical protein